MTRRSEPPTGSSIWMPLLTCCLISSYSSLVRRAALYRMSRLMSSLPMSCSIAAALMSSILSAFSSIVSAMMAAVGRHALAVMSRVGVLRHEVAQDHQHAVIGLAQLSYLRVLALAQAAHHVAGDEQRAAPHHHVEPLVQARARCERPGLKMKCGAVHQEQDHHQHARERGERGVPLAIQVRRAERRQHVEAEHHPLRCEHLVQEQCNRKQRQQYPQLLVHPFEAADLRAGHSCDVDVAKSAGASPAPGCRCRSISRARESARSAASRSCSRPPVAASSLLLERRPLRFGRLQLVGDCDRDRPEARSAETPAGRVSRRHLRARTPRAPASRAARRVLSSLRRLACAGSGDGCVPVSAAVRAGPASPAPAAAAAGLRVYVVVGVLAKWWSLPPSGCKRRSSAVPQPIP